MSKFRTRIKICGITNAQDAAAAVTYGADALGFIFVPKTPRFVGESADLGPLLTGLPPFVTKVAVCLEPSQVTPQIAGAISAIQYYSGNGSFDEHVNTPRVRAIRVKDEFALDDIAQAIAAANNRITALLLDGYHVDKLGGSGEVFNWDIAREAKERFGLPIILAGGLTPENVTEAIRSVRPYAVDVSSGVEAEPGRKDLTKLRAFIEAVTVALE